MIYEKVLDFPEIGSKRFVRYDGPVYQVGITLYKNGFVQTHIYLRQEAPKFSPNLFIAEDKVYLPKGVKIETTSYGSLSVDDMKLFCRQMEEAVSAAEFIQKAFIEPLRAGTFVFDDDVTA